MNVIAFYTGCVGPYGQLLRAKPAMFRTPDALILDFGFWAGSNSSSKI
jgi:hypothetical protein